MRRALGTAAGMAALGLLLAAGPTAATARGSDSERESQRIRMQDDCDPATFTAALGPGSCVGDGDTTFEELVTSLLAGMPDEHWRNHPSRTRVRPGQGLAITNTGGEFHTFTEVAHFGPGCVTQLNDLLGLTGAPAADCGAAFSDPQTALPAGASGMVGMTHLTPGVHLFQCMVHPWMQTTVDVRR